MTSTVHSVCIELGQIEKGGRLQWVCPGTIGWCWKILALLLSSPVSAYVALHSPFLPVGLWLWFAVVSLQTPLSPWLFPQPCSPMHKQHPEWHKMHSWGSRYTFRLTKYTHRYFTHWLIESFIDVCLVAAKFWKRTRSVESMSRMDAVGHLFLHL